MQADVLTQARYVDTHFHLDVCQEPSAVVEAVSRSEISVVAVTNAPFVFDSCVALAGTAARIVVALGMHPQLAARCQNQLSMFRDRLSSTRFVGEVGLDYQPQGMKDRDIQRKVFEEVLNACHEHGDKILTVHSRRATEDVVAMLDTGFHGTAILHWFSGSLPELHRAEAGGAFFSVNPAMIESQHGCRLVDAMRRDRVLTETDGPYVRIAGRPAAPRDVVSVIDALASLWRCDRDAVRTQLMANLADALTRGPERSKA